MFSEDQIKALSAPLDRSAVKTRDQAGRKVSYIEAYHAENEANRIFGFDAWDRETELTLLGEPRVTKDKYGNDQYRVGYRAKVRITVRTPGGAVVIREGCGFGSGIDKDVDQAHESALKEAESDAEKRALKTFGNPFGQALYDKEQREVAAAPKQAPKDEKPAGSPELFRMIKATIEAAKDLPGLQKVWTANITPEHRSLLSDAEMAALTSLKDQQKAALSDNPFVSA